MKKTILCLLVIVALFTITGCGKDTKEKGKGTKKDKNTYVCVKNNVEDSSAITNQKWKEDITFTAKLDNDGKLTYYSDKYVYKYESKEDCEYWCDIKVKWNDEINAKNYTGGHRETNCFCDKKQLVEEDIYDDIPNLASILRSDIRQLKDDNTFDLKEWLSIRKKNGYKCN